MGPRGEQMERLRRSKLRIVLALLAIFLACEADDCQDQFYEAWEYRVNTLHQPDQLAFFGALLDTVFDTPPWGKRSTWAARSPADFLCGARE